MISNTLFIIFLFSFFTVFAEKHAYVIVGPASSGTLYITKHLRKVLNARLTAATLKLQKFKHETIVVHISIPFISRERYIDLQGIKEWLDDYKLTFILTTRDVSIVDTSKQRRFPKIAKSNQKDREVSRQILTEIMETEKFFVWNYETMIYLQDAYFQQLYKFLEINACNVPTGLKDGNYKYLN